MHSAFWRKNSIFFSNGVYLQSLCAVYGREQYLGDIILDPSPALNFLFFMKTFCSPFIFFVAFVNNRVYLDG